MFRGRSSGGSSTNHHNHGDEVDPARLAQSVAFVDVDTVTRQFVPGVTEVMAVAKPFASSKVYEATGETHVPRCEGQNTAQNLQAALGLMYRNASAVLWNSQLIEAKSNESKVHQRRPTFLSVPIWMARDVAVVGTLELLIHTVDPMLRNQVWIAREGGGAGFLSVSDIERLVKQQQSQQALDNVFGQGNDDDASVDADDNDEKKGNGDNVSSADLNKAKLLLSLTPLEAANYLIHGGSIAALDPGCNATASAYVNQTLFGLKRHYFLYAGVDAPTEQKVDLNVSALFSLPNALTILLRRSEAHSVVCSAAGRDIRTAVDLINAVYGGPLPPSEDKARQAHNHRALAIANDDAAECVRTTGVLQEALKELKQEQVAYASFADKVRREAGKGLVPQFRPFTTLVRDLYEDIRLTQLDPAKLIRAFLPLTAASSSSRPKTSSQGIELKEHLFAQRDHFKETVVDPLVASLPEIHVSEEANEQFRRARRMLLPTALAILGRAYPEPMPECFDVLRELQPLTSPKDGVNPIMSPMVTLETCEMTPSDNLLMRLCQVMRDNNLDANAASWAVTCMQLLLSTSLVKGQARENFVLSGGHAAGKSYTLKELTKLLFGADLMVEVRTATSQKSGQNTIYPQVNDEAEAGVATIWDLLKRRGMFGVYDTSNETRDRKATMSQQSITYSKNDYKDPITGQSRNKPVHTILFANTLGATNFPTLLGTDQAVSSRARDANPLSSLGSIEAHISWLPDAFDKAQKLKTWSDLRLLNFVCFFGFHCRTMGLFQPLKSDTGLMIGHSVVSSVTHSSENAFGALFSSASNNTTNRSDMDSAFMNRLRDNLESTHARSLMFQLAEMVPDADETLNYYKRRRLLDQIVDLLHMGLPAVAYTRNDSVSLLTQRDTRYIRSLIETLEYQSAMLSVFNNNAAGASYTRGSFFDRMQVLEDAHCDQTVESVLKGLQSCSWLDVRIIDGALAILALYCQISAQELSPILPDAKGIITFRNFFQAMPSASNQLGDKGNDGVSRDTRIFYFFRRLNQVFARPIWETKTANEMLMLLMFVRVVGSNQSLLDYRDFDDKSDNVDLHIDVRVMLYGHFASMINNKISVLSRPVESLGFHSTLEHKGTFRCSPTVYSLEPRCPSPDSLPPNSMWRQRVTREILFRENKSWLQQRVIEASALQQRRSISVPVASSSSSAEAMPLTSPKRALSETTASTLINDHESNSDESDAKGPTDDALLEDCMEQLETQVRTIELEKDDEESKVTNKKHRAAVFVANGNNFQSLRLQPTEEIPAVAQNLLNNIETAQNPRACYVFQRLIRVSHVPLTVHTDEQESSEYKLAGVWRAAFHQIEFSPSQRTNFTRRLSDLLELLRSNANDKIAEINIRTKTLAARISRLASRYSASQPLFMGMSMDSNEIQWLNVEHLDRPFDHFPPVKAHNVWRNVILERTRYAHYTLNNSQLIYERQGILLDADLREREREQRFHRLYPNLQHERLWCSSENLRTNQRFIARIMHLVKLLEPIFKFHAAIVCDESDDEALCFHGTPLLDIKEGKYVRRVFTHAPYQDSAHFLADARSSEQETAASIYVLTYKALLYEALVLFFEYMRWKASLQGMLCVTVDADLCHYTAESLGLVYCTRIIDTLAAVVTSPNLLDNETIITVSSAVKNWIDEVIFEYKPQRDGAVDRFTLNQQAVSQLPFSLADLRRSVFVPAFEDFPLKHEVIMQRFAPYSDFVPLVSSAMPPSRDMSRLEEEEEEEDDDHDAETEEQREDVVII